MSDRKTPACIGFILDGNRRWAKEHGLPTLEGHRRGGEKMKELIAWTKEADIQHMVVYAFSTENWNRSAEEVAYLMDLFEEYCDAWTDEVQKQGGRIRFIGQRERFRNSIQAKIIGAEGQTKDGTGGTLWVALSYGGRVEIINAVNKLLTAGVTEANEESLRNAMWSADMPDPDLIIRTGGEQRLSNFLTWQSIYSELFFTDTKLPAFTKEEFSAILKEYTMRERRNGT